jgi:exodeoxyribonuclease VII large subunit
MLPKTLTVTELTQNIKFLLEENFPQVYLQGEISNLARPSSGHVYFNLKDEQSQIAGVMFRSAAQRSKFDLENGLEVILLGRITVYEPRGTYQIVVEHVEPVGAGALQLAFEQLKTRLAREGLFDEETKLPVPFLPNGIGIVTSPTGAAIKDILNVLNRRFPSIPVLLNPVAVQGQGAAKEIAEAVHQFSKIPEIDVLIVGRGGGSIEDLWAFNEEVVARAVYKSKIPIISAVGHETDFTIIDFVADLRAPTPSAAAELVSPEKNDLVARIDELNSRMVSVLQNDLNSVSDRLSYIHRGLRSPEWIIQGQMMKIDELSGNLVRSMQRRLLEIKNSLDSNYQNMSHSSPLQWIQGEKNLLKELQSKLIEKTTSNLKNGRHQLMELTHVLSSVNPLSVINRGYTVVTDSRNKLLSSVSQFAENSKFWLRLPDGKVKGETKQIVPTPSKGDDNG